VPEADPKSKLIGKQKAQDLFRDAKGTFYQVTGKELGSVGKVDSPLFNAWRVAISGHDLRCAAMAVKLWALEVKRSDVQLSATPIETFLSNAEGYLDAADQELACQIEEQKNILLTKKQVIQRAHDGSDPIDYESIDYEFAIYVYTILCFSSEGMNSGKIHDVLTLGLCPSDEMTMHLLLKLYRAGILIFSPETDSAAISSVEPDGSFRFLPGAIKWEFAFDVHGKSMASIFEAVEITLLDTPLTDVLDTVHNLWTSVAIADGISYLERKMSEYRISGFERNDKVEKCMTHALKNFSIPQVRSLLNSVAKNTLATIQTDGFRQRGINMVPGGVIAMTDRAVASKWNVYPYCYKWAEEAPIITVLFDKVLRTGADGFRVTSGNSLLKMAV
jgi:hypothetical protein